MTDCPLPQSTSSSTDNLQIMTEWRKEQGLSLSHGALHHHHFSAAEFILSRTSQRGIFLLWCSGRLFQHRRFWVPKRLLQKLHLLPGETHQRSHPDSSKRRLHSQLGMGRTEFLLDPTPVDPAYRDGLSGIHRSGWMHAHGIGNELHSSDLSVLSLQDESVLELRRSPLRSL
jgi:hypothetical protein